MRKEIHWPLHVVLTDEEQEFCYDDDCFYLSEETGWWDEDTGTIYIWWPELSSFQKLGILTHEFLEKWLVRIGIPDKYAHNAVNIIEKLISLGEAELVWR